MSIFGICFILFFVICTLDVLLEDMVEVENRLNHICLYLLHEQRFLYILLEARCKLSLQSKPNHLQVCGNTCACV